MARGGAASLFRSSGPSRDRFSCHGVGWRMKFDILFGRPRRCFHHGGKGQESSRYGSICLLYILSRGLSVVPISDRLGPFQFDTGSSQFSLHPPGSCRRGHPNYLRNSKSADRTQGDWKQTHWQVEVVDFPFPQTCLSSRGKLQVARRESFF